MFHNYITYLGNFQIEAKLMSGGSRFDYDPRALEDRKIKKIEELALKELRTPSDGKAAILHFFPPEQTLWQEEPNLSVQLLQKKR